MLKGKEKKGKQSYNAIESLLWENLRTQLTPIVYLLLWGWDGEEATEDGLLLLRIRKKTDQSICESTLQISVLLGHKEDL